MSKPDITLQPSKGIISEAAARIYAAYIAAGHVQENDADIWIKRAIREAIVIAKTVDASIDSHDSLTFNETIILRSNVAATQQEDKEKEKRAAKKILAKTKEAIPHNKKESIEELAEEVLLEESTPLELEEDPGASNDTNLESQT